MRVYQRGSKWWIDFNCGQIDCGDKHCDRGRHREPTISPTKALAKKILDQRRTEATNEKHFPTKERVKFSEMIKKYVDGYSKTNHLAQKTVTSIINNKLEPFFGTLFLDQIGSEKIESYKKERDSTLVKRRCEKCSDEGKPCQHQFFTKLKPSSINRELQVLRHILNVAYDWEYLSQKPRKVKLLRTDNAVLRFLSPEETSELLKASPPKLRPIILTGIYTGGRRGELLGLRWGQVDFDHNVIHFLKTKSGKAREINIHPSLRAELISVRGLDGLLPGWQNKYVFDIENSRKLFDKAVKDAKLKHVGWHTLRHTFAANLALQSVDLNTIRELMGHASITMTLRYAHLTKGHKADAISKLRPIFFGTNLAQKEVVRDCLPQKYLVNNNFPGSSMVERPAVNDAKENLESPHNQPSSTENPDVK